MDRKCLCFYRFWITLMEIFTLSVDPSVLSCSDRTNRSCPGCLFSPRMKTVALSASLSSDRPSASMQAGPPEAGYSYFVMMGPLLLWTWTPQHHRGSPWCLLMIWGFVGTEPTGRSTAPLRLVRPHTRLQSTHRSHKMASLVQIRLSLSKKQDPSEQT